MSRERENMRENNLLRTRRRQKISREPSIHTEIGVTKTRMKNRQKTRAGAREGEVHFCPPPSRARKFRQGKLEYFSYRTALFKYWTKRVGIFSALSGGCILE